MHTISPPSSEHALHESSVRSALDAQGGIERFLEQGFLQFRYDPSFLAEHVPPITEGMRRMIDGDDRDAFAADVFAYDNVGWKNDSGLYRRNEREQKWFFHCFKETGDRMHARGAPVRKYADFFMALESINRRSLDIAKIVASLLDTYHAEKSLPLPCALLPAFEAGFAVTRCLRYLERDKGKPDAAPHFDRDGITVHWWGSRQGLIVVDRDGTKHRVLETEFDTICIFPGKKFGGLTEYRYGNGTLHGVIDTARESGAEGDRLALVTFVHPALSDEVADLVRARDPLCEAIEKTYVL